MCKYESTCTRSFLHAYEDPILCTHSDFQKPKKKKKQVFYIYVVVWNESHIVWDRSKPLLTL